MESNLTKNKDIVICIGAAKAGTSWLNECLYEHPEISASTIGELDYFTYNWDKDFAWYKGCFQNKGRILFDCSPSYQFYKEVPERVLSTFGDQCKFILIVRNPLERALSHFKMHYRAGRFDKNIDYHLKNYPRYIGDSLYYKNYTRFINQFPNENVKIFLYEDLKNDPKSFLEKIYTFMGVEDVFFTPSILNKRYHQAKGVPKHAFFYKGMVSLVTTFKKRKGLHFLYEFVTYLRKRGVGNLIPRSSEHEYPKASEETLTFLREHFKTDTHNLKSIVSFDPADLWKL